MNKGALKLRRWKAQPGNFYTSLATDVGDINASIFSLYASAARRPGSRVSKALWRLGIAEPNDWLTSLSGEEQAEYESLGGTWEAA